jgi:hypothetical protein
MARGKHANRAEAARVRDELEREVARLQRELRRVTSERDELQKVFDDAEQAYEVTMRRLEMRIADGASDEVDRLKAHNIRLLHERAVMEGRAQGAADALAKATRGMRRYLNSMGMTREQALVTVRTWIGRDVEFDEMDKHMATVKLFSAGTHSPEGS